MADIYMLATFLPQGIKTGDEFEFKYRIPLKITPLQKEMIVADFPGRQALIEEALKRLKALDPDLIDRHKEGYRFAVLKPEATPQYQGVEEYLNRVARGQLDVLQLDLTDFVVLKIQ